VRVQPAFNGRRVFLAVAGRQDFDHLIVRQRHRRANRYFREFDSGYRIGLDPLPVMRKAELPREVAYSIMRLLPVSHQDKYRYRYEDYGCFRCGTKDEPHQSLSLCASCYALLHSQIKAGIVRHARSEDLSPAQLTANLTRTSDNARRILADIGTPSHPRRKPALPAPKHGGRK